MFTRITSARYQPEQNDHVAADIARIGETYMVVWRSYFESGIGAQSPDVHRARVAAAGTETPTLDLGGGVRGTELPGAGGVPMDPSVAASRDQFLMVWPVCLRDCLESRLVSMRMTEEGGYRTTSPVELVDASFWPKAPSVASDGTSFLVVFESQLTNELRRISGVLVDATGAPGRPFPIHESDGPDFLPTVTWDGEQYLVVYQTTAAHSFDLRGAYVSRDGVLAPGAGFPIAVTDTAQETRPRIASGTLGSVITWIAPSSITSTTNRQIEAAFVARGSTAVTAFSVMGASSVEFRPDIAWHRDHFICSWLSGSRAVHAIRLRPDGTRIDATPFELARGADARTAPAVAGGGAHALLVWDKNFHYDRDRRRHQKALWGTRILSSDLSMPPRATDVPEFPVAADRDALVRMERPNIASTTLGHLIVWNEARPLRHGIWGARLNSSGASIDPAGFFVTSLAGERFAVVADVAGREGYRVIFENGGNLRMVSVSASLDVSNSIAVAQASRIPREISWEKPVAANSGESTLVAALTGSPASRSVVGFHVDADNRSTPLPTIYDGSTWSVSVGGSAAGWLVVWDALGVLRAARIDAAGNVVDSMPLMLTEEFSEQSSISISSDGDGYIVAWTHQPYFLDVPSVRVTRVAADGTVVDGSGITVSGSGAAASRPKAVHDGSSYWIGWTTEENRVEVRRFHRDGSLSAIRTIANEGVLAGLSSSSAGTVAVISRDGALYSSLLR